MFTIANALTQSKQLEQLSDRAMQLLAETIGKNTAYLLTHPEQSLTDKQFYNFSEGLKRLQQGEPLPYILGWTEFYHHRFKVTPAVLIPRPATETLLEQLLETDLPKDARILECGTGSGALAISMAKEHPDWHIDAFDISEAALAVAAENCQQLNVLNVTLFASDWFEQVSETDYDAIISNPPYIAHNDSHCDASVKQYEPQQALFAQQQGLAAIAHLTETAGRYLKPGGWCWLEHGFEQKDQVRDLFQRNGWKQIESVRDLQGHWRLTGARYGG